MSKGKVVNLPKKCEECDDCSYIGDGDHICMVKNPPVFVISGWIPTDEYNWCRKDNK